MAFFFVLVVGLVVPLPLLLVDLSIWTFDPDCLMDRFLPAILILLLAFPAFPVFAAVPPPLCLLTWSSARCRYAKLLGRTDDDPVAGLVHFFLPFS